MTEWSTIFNDNIQTYMSIINSYLIANGGRFLNVGRALSKLSFALPDGLKMKHYQTSGKYPIISQSKEFIIGYSDFSKSVINKDLPLIVFGDHTKVIKYIDFPFLIGADGVKLLKPIEEIYPKYFYYSILGIPLDTKGYGRHFKLLKASKFVFIEDINIQRKISNFLDDFYKNELNKKEYFCKEIENKIIAIHNSTLKINKIKYNITYQLSLLKKPDRRPALPAGRMARS